MGHKEISSADVTIVIPTYGREKVLVDTLEMLSEQTAQPHEILIIDQTPTHEAETLRALRKWESQGRVRRISFSPPSIPHAMNTGLLEARTDYVHFLDDDIIPDRELIACLVETINDIAGDLYACIVGQIIQPDEEVICFQDWAQSWFPFNSDQRQQISDVMAGNLCVNRKYALQVGGFDENFKGSAYRFESDFARRVIRAGGKILFEPSVSMRHLRSARGGTRVGGNQLTTWRPHHSVGKYYYAFQGGLSEAMKTVLIQPLRAIRTKHHLRRPWWIPVSLLAECLGIAWALILRVRGPQLLTKNKL